MFLNTKDLKAEKIVQRLPLDTSDAQGGRRSQKVASSGAVTPVQEQVVVQIEDQNFTWGIKTFDFDDKMDEITREVWKIRRTKTEEIREYENSMKRKEEQRTEQRRLDAVITLQNINISIKKGQLVFVVGKIASGKSSLLSAIIGELLPVPSRLIDSYGGREGLEKALDDQEAEAFQAELADQ